jgi:hypothetical protein
VLNVEICCKTGEMGKKLQSPEEMKTLGSYQKTFLNGNHHRLLECIMGAVNLHIYSFSDAHTIVAVT